MSRQFSHQQLVSVVKLSAEDLDRVNQRRQPYTRLGFAYQLAFVRLANRFPAQRPTLEIEEEVLTFISVQLGLPVDLIHTYAQHQSTLSEHQEEIRSYLKLRRFSEAGMTALTPFLFEEACRLEQTAPLLNKAQQFLREQRILQPAEDTLRRLITAQRTQARHYIFDRFTKPLSPEIKKKLDALLQVEEARTSPLQAIKQAPVFLPQQLCCAWPPSWSRLRTLAFYRLISPGSTTTISAP